MALASRASTAGAVALSAWARAGSLSQRSTAVCAAALTMIRGRTACTVPASDSGFEKSAASRFTVYSEVLRFDPATQQVFHDILHDEMFHMNYTLTQLLRVAPQRHRKHLWRARLSRLWKAYLRLATEVIAREREFAREAMASN